MKNREKYAKEISDLVFSGNARECELFIRPIIIKKDSCSGIGCVACQLYQNIWLDEEYVEEEEVVDWDKVEKGTMIEVSTDNIKWLKRKFIGIFENRFIFESSQDNSNWVCWEYARLIK